MIFDQSQKINLKNKITASLICLILIILGLTYFIVVPTIKAIKTVSAEIEEQRIDLEKKYIRGNNLKLLAENLKKIEPKLSTLDKIFINKNRELEFITTLENEANNAKINQKITLTSPETAENQGYKKIGLQLFTRGDFNQQLKYLTSLESLNYYINIKLLEISSSPGDGPDALSNINLAVVADTYWK